MVKIEFKVVIESIDAEPSWAPNAGNMQYLLQTGLRGWKAEVTGVEDNVEMDLDTGVIR